MRAGHAARCTPAPSSSPPRPRSIRFSGTVCRRHLDQARVLLQHGGIQCRRNDPRQRRRDRGTRSSPGGELHVFSVFHFHYALQYLMDEEQFFERELKYRQWFMLPPFASVYEAGAARRQPALPGRRHARALPEAQGRPADQARSTWFRASPSAGPTAASWSCMPRRKRSSPPGCSGSKKSSLSLLAG